MNDGINITLSAPRRRDLESFWPSDGRIPGLLMGSVKIETPCATPEEAEASLAFLAELVTISRIQETHIQDALLWSQGPRLTPGSSRGDEPQAEYPDEADQEIISDDPPLEEADKVYDLVFLHEKRTSVAPRTIWRSGDDVIVHFDEDGEEAGMAMVDPDPVSVAARASIFGPITEFLVRPVDEGPFDPWQEAAG